METAHLFHLASISHPSTSSSLAPQQPKILAAACHMVFADRTGGSFIDPLVVAELEPRVGRTCLDAIIAWRLGEGRTMGGEGCVWEVKA